jgi:uncharacterized protein (TIGR02268 family)
VAPGSPTFIRLDALIVRESVEVEGGAGFFVDAGDRTLSIEPSVALGPKDRVVLRATFRQGTPPRATFLLVPATSEVDTVVLVSRPPEPAVACQVELAATHERCDALARELEADSRRVSPAALALAGLLDSQGVKGGQLSGCADRKGALRTRDCVRLRGSAWAVMFFDVINAGKEPWTPVQATLRPTVGGEPRTVGALLSLQATVAPGVAVRVAVEVEMSQSEQESWFTESYTLAVCDAAGRCLTFENVEL